MIFVLAAVAALLVLLILQITARAKVNRVIQVYLDKAEVDRCDKARIPVTELTELGYSGNLGLYVKGMRSAPKGGHDRHPATLSPARRRGL